MITTNILAMYLPPTDNLHHGGGSDDDAREYFLEECRRYVRDPYGVPLLGRMLPCDMIRPLLDDVRPSRQESIIGNAIYYRVIAFEPEHSGKITAMLLDQASREEIFYMCVRLLNHRALPGLGS